MRLRNIIQEKKENTEIVGYFADLVKKHEPKDLLGKMFTPYYGRISLYNQYNSCTAGYAYDAYGFWYDTRSLEGIDYSDAPPTYMKLRHGMIVGIGWVNRVPNDISRYWDYIEEDKSFRRRGAPAYYDLYDDNKTVRTYWWANGFSFGKQKGPDDSDLLLKLIVQYGARELHRVSDFYTLMSEIIKFVNGIYDKGHFSGNARQKALETYYDNNVLEACYDGAGNFIDELKRSFDAELLPLINDESRP